MLKQVSSLSTAATAFQKHQIVSDILRACFILQDLHSNH